MCHVTTGALVYIKIVDRTERSIARPDQLNVPLKMILLLSLIALATSIPFLPLSTTILSLRYQNTSWLSPGSVLSIERNKTPFQSIYLLTTKKKQRPNQS